jgi:predicted TIM-barrel fold metal-dependent hydrolase
MESRHTRREVLQSIAAVATATAGASLAACASNSPVAVNWSTGTERPKSKAPGNSVDCHHHIYDARFPTAPNATLKPGDASVADYRALQRRIGTKRNVIVQPSTYGIDNRLLVESLAAFGKNARGVAVVNTEVTDAELKQLHAAGVRGIRFNLAPPGTTTLDMVRPLAQRVAPLGWHVQVNAPAAALREAQAIWSDLPCPVVFDHLGRVLQPGKLDQATFAMVRELVQKDKAWVKLSGFYLDSQFRAPTYADSVKIASTYATEGPERVVWGSDWPHPTEHAKNLIPDDALLFDLLSEAVPNDGARKRVLVDNPAKLYQFA